MKILAVTSCPAGLAHTPMAAKALTDAGKKMGHDIKVEQQGIMGRVNAITEEDTKDVAFLLIASDQHIDGMERFEGIKTIRVKIGVALKQPEAVLQKCIDAISK